MIDATNHKSFGQSLFEKKKRKSQKQKGSHSKKTRVPLGNRSNKRSALVIHSLLAEKDCEQEMMIVIPEQKEKRLIDFGYRPEEHKPRPMRTVLVLREFWNLYGTDLFKMIASHLDLSSLKIFMFLSKNIYHSLFHQKSSDNSWAVDIYSKYYLYKSLVERGIQRAIDLDRIGYCAPYCSPKMIKKLQVPCNCCFCRPKWMTQKPGNERPGEIVFTHQDYCITPYCDCGWAGPQLFPQKRHCDCLLCNGKFDFIQRCVWEGCPHCGTTMEFSTYPEDFVLKDYHSQYSTFDGNCKCDGCQRSFGDGGVKIQENGHCPKCDTTATIINICERCWLEGHYPKRTENFLFTDTSVSMTKDALTKFNEFSLSELFKYDKQLFIINRWFRFTALFLWRSHLVRRKFFIPDYILEDEGQWFTHG